MINGLGVVGWGVGGIEAEAVMLGQPIYMLVPEVVGFRLTGKLPEGDDGDRPRAARHGDAAGARRRREVRRVLRPRPRSRCRSRTGRRSPTWRRSTARPWASSRSTRRPSNYMRLTGRDEKLIGTVEAYCKEQGLWRDDERRAVVYTADAGARPRLRSSRRWPDRSVRRTASRFRRCARSGRISDHLRIDRSAKASGESNGHRRARRRLRGRRSVRRARTFADGDVVIAAITSCTNTSNPAVMVAAGLVAEGGGAGLSASRG